MKTLYTIGHSTRSIEEFTAILRAHEIELLCDVRSIPGSRRNPQYGQDALTQSLKSAEINYQWLKDLGGRRRTTENSPNMGWRNASFRSYADYMQTEAFAKVLSELEALAQEKKTAIMCAEAVPWRCHRSLIADVLVVRGWQVLDIFEEHTAKKHALNPMARVLAGRIIYPPLPAKQSPLR